MNSVSHDEHARRAQQVYDPIEAAEVRNARKRLIGYQFTVEALAVHDSRLIKQIRAQIADEIRERATGDDFGSLAHMVWNKVADFVEQPDA